MESTTKSTAMGRAKVIAIVSAVFAITIFLAISIGRPSSSLSSTTPGTSNGGSEKNVLAFRSSTKKKSSSKSKDKSDSKVGIDISELSSSVTSAPLFMQVNDESNKDTHPLFLLFKKYGLTGEKPTKEKQPTNFSNKNLLQAQKAGGKSGSGSGEKASKYGWIYTVVSSGDSCTGTEYMNAGVVIDTCIPITSSLSVVVECSDDEVSYYEYASEECTGSVQSSKVIATTGCNQALNESSWFNFDDDGYPSSFEVKCTSTTTPPYEASSQSFDVWSAYDESQTSSTTCSSSNFNYYEAYVTDVCIPIQVFSTQSNDESVMFKGSSSDDDDADDDSSGTPWIKYYTAKRTCSGTHTTYDLSKDCEAIGALEWAQEWSYFESS